MTRIAYNHRGFTLLEVMVAMVLFSIFSLMAYLGLNSVLENNKATETHAEAFNELKRTFLFLDRDLRQLVSRPRRTGYAADEIEAALVSGLDGEGVLEFSRAGNPNFNDQVRSSLQRVRYMIEDKQLFRLSWHHIDHLDQEPVRMKLLHGIEALEFRFLAKDNDWQENWGDASRKEQTSLPKAIEIKLQHARWGEIERIVPILIHASEE